MTMFFQLLVIGIAMGFIYALVAIEYTLVWNACQLLNFSHTKIIMFGAYVFAGTFIGNLRLPTIFAIILSILVMGLLGIFIAYVIFLPLKNMTRLCAIIGTFMLGWILSESTRFIWGANPLTVKGFLTGIVHVGEAIIARVYIYIIIVTLIAIVLLLIFMNKTKFGKAMRCVAENKGASALMGIDVSFIIVISIALSCMICCIIGILVVPLYSVHSSMAELIGLKGFAAGIIGGFGSVPGALLGGILLGIAENLLSIVIPSLYKDIVSFLLMIGVLLIKPNGLLGMRKETAKKHRLRRQKVVM